jgi:hypothetical protein
VLTALAALSFLGSGNGCLDPGDLFRAERCHKWRIRLQPRRPRANRGDPAALGRWRPTSTTTRCKSLLASSLLAGSSQLRPVRDETSEPSCVYTTGSTHGALVSVTAPP